LFRAVYLGVAAGAGLHMPPRRGGLFDPQVYPFLEGWGPGGSPPVTEPAARAAVRVPTVDDGTIHRVLEKLLVFEGQRLSYRTLDVEQIGSVYEALMGYHVTRVSGPAVRIRGAGVWLTAGEVLDVAPRQRPKWIKERTGLPKAQATKLAAAIEDAAPDEAAVLDALATVAFGRTREQKAAARAPAGRLVLQPGSERRRTSSHYTPRSLTEPIVRRTIEPLLACMGEAPPSNRILELKICDPAMGSGAFLVEACRFLADQLVAAWTREGALEGVAKDAPGEDPTLHARRLVAQKCLYGVDKNEPAVELAKLSLWLITLAKDLPFTFLDHALRHGDSLVGLDFDQIRAFHWSPDGKSSGKKTTKRKKSPQQLPLPIIGDQLDQALDEAIALRQQVLDLAANPDPQAQRDKERLVDDADDALRRIRLVADLIVGAFFAEQKDKPREKELARRRSLTETWLASDQPIPEELAALQSDLRARTPAFHWMLELPEVFHANRPDPLDGMAENGAAFMDGFVGNPPFAGKNGITETNGDGYLDWLKTVHQGAHGNADLSAHFFRRAATLVGDHGTMGLIATNTIAQGDTRATGLKHLVANEGLDIYAATRSAPWPGAEAAVTV
ncbi:MAG TPA: N-6 DNA methylase, partial [Polyangiaceae bacterium LLY-WYZ-14_1]|nr:N-6 DNA methylase [Polyangiaceae bacterium LLY-WYZ-14_1]